jgi:DNA-binding LytR/AlgR family response regulator
VTEQKIRILIVEDNPIIAEDLAAYMEDFGHSAMATADCADEALKLLKTELPDLLLLDVGLEGEIDGIQLANIIKEKYEIPFIFLTALHDDQTIARIKETQPNAYLVKPIDERSLQTTIEVALYNFSHRKPNQDDGSKQEENFIKGDHFFIKVKNRLVKIQLTDVLFFEAYDNYAYVHTSEKKYIISMSLKSVETKLSGKSFARSHRSYIVNMSKIDSIEEDNLIIEEHKVPIGKTHRSEIMKSINLL